MCTSRDLHPQSRMVCRRAGGLLAGAGRGLGRIVPTSGLAAGSRGWLGGANVGWGSVFARCHDVLVRGVLGLVCLGIVRWCHRGS